MQNDSIALRVSSPSFADGGPMPARHTGFGEDVSPALALHDLDARAVTLAIVMDDLDIPFIPAYTHWLIWNLPAWESIPEALPPGAQLPECGGAQQGLGYGRHRYRGPKPPIFEWRRHRYVFHVYALDVRLNLPADARRRDLLRAMQGHILQQAKLTGTCRRRDVFFH
ncbi:MAG: YbhB/YbcL family Raf kinase inhibitor-like protein [Clostridia bacterium]|nr:YbhB/YbcL family Raf kinase inhibitor-like protein [Clostridia bacterium]